ncbi:MAG: TIGR03767 family metallophosphoesterase [Streptosporangiaceae bacterium]
MTSDTPLAATPDQSSGISRRRALRTAALGAAATGLVVYPSRASAAAGLKGPTAGTTLDSTLRLGPAGAGGYRKVVAGPGEPYLLRTDLGGTAGKWRATKRKPVVSFGHLTDVHLVDSQSPARIEYIDRLSDPGSVLSALPVTGAYRAQEILTAHVAESMVRAINRVGRGPATGAPLAFTINTGDAADNAQLNEQRWMIDLLDGRKVRQDSGDLSRFEGVMGWGDRRFWQPEAAGNLHGFPRVQGLLDAARRPFEATGLRTPWYSVYGNHDGLIQGNVPLLPLFRDLAVGGVKIVAPVTDAQQKELAAALRRGDARQMADSRSDLFRKVTPDPGRRLLSRAETVREHGTHHGYTAANLKAGTAYYGFDRGLMRGLVLDSCNPAGYAEGSLDRAQFAWLERELIAGSSHYLGRTGSKIKHRVRDRLFVLFSHHTLDTMANPLGEGRVLGPEIEKLLLRFPNVVLWVNGHTHVNEVTVHPRKSGGGFWEVSTAAHIDWPQQSRIVEIADNRDGTLSIFATVIDSAAPGSHGGSLNDPAKLASLARELSGNDWQGKVEAGSGTRADRNVELLLPAPF